MSSDGHVLVPAPRPIIDENSFRMFDPSTRQSIRPQAGSRSSQTLGSNQSYSITVKTDSANGSVKKASKKRRRHETQENGDKDDGNARKWTEHDLTNLFQFLFGEENNDNWRLLEHDRRAALVKV